MKKDKGKAAETQLLALLKLVLPKATHDAKLAGRIYEAIEAELRAKAKVSAFEDLCARIALPDLNPQSVEDVRQRLAVSFGEEALTIEENEEEQTLSVEVALPDGRQFSSQIKVNPNAQPETEGEQEVTLKFIASPVSLPGDPELVWYLARRENMTPEEAGILLEKLEEDFWASKTGQMLIRKKGVERSFPEFMARAPSGMLTEVGLKRHYKLPEAVKVLRPQKKR